MLIEVKTMKKIALLFVLCCMFFNTTPAFASTIYFSDVPHLHSAHSEINYLANNGVIRGTSADTFSPNNYVTNRQLAAMLVRALQLGNEAPRNPGLKDVSPFDSGYKEIAIAIQNGIFPKTSYFHPNAHATREGIARALTHAFQLKGNQQAVFKDIPKNYWAYQYIDALAANNITTGYPDKTFIPKNKLTRAHFSMFLARALEPKIRPVNRKISYPSNLIPNASWNGSSQFFGSANQRNIFGTRFTDLQFRKEATGLIVEGNFNNQRVVLYEDTPKALNIYAGSALSVEELYHGLTITYPIYEGKTWNLPPSEFSLGTKYEVVKTNDYILHDDKWFADVVKLKVTSLTKLTNNFDQVIPPSIVYIAPNIGIIATYYEDNVGPGMHEWVSEETYMNTYESVEGYTPWN